MFEGDCADTCARNCSTRLMGVREEGLVCADPGVRTPISVSRNFLLTGNLLFCGEAFISLLEAQKLFHLTTAATCSESNNFL